MEKERDGIQLRKKCPLCSEAEALSFLTCRGCSNTIVICDECGSVFPDPQKISKKDTAEELQLCPQCKELPITSYRMSGADEVEALGFNPKDYV